MLTRFTTLLLVLLAALLLAACGGDDDSSTDDSGSGDTATETAEDTAEPSTEDDSGDTAAGGTILELGVEGNELKFDTTELTAPAGSVTLKLTNASSIQHNVAIEDEEGELVADGGVSEVTIDLEPGTYEYYCTPHKGAGMTGTLTVT